MNNASHSLQDFSSGLVFGFDLGTGSIGWAVRRGSQFLDVGVLICPEDTNDLSGRRGLRRQRRTLDHRQNRRDWFAENLAGVLGLKLHPRTRLPTTAWKKTETGNWVPASAEYANPVTLRVDALSGKPLTAEQLFTALSHVVRRRGQAEKVPWSKSTAEQKREKEEEEKQQVNDTIPASKVRQEFENARCKASDPANYHPAHLLKELAEDNRRQRKRAWPRDLLEAEAEAILKVQSAHWKKLNETVRFTDVSKKERTATMSEWLLRGNSAVKLVHESDQDFVFNLFYRNHRERERAPFTFQAARIHNRQPGLDLVEPYDNLGHPRYVMLRKSPEYRQWQAKVALLNFKVLDLSSRKSDKPRVVPSTDALAQLRDIIERTGRLSVEDLQVWVKPYKEKGIYDLVDEQPALIGEGEGRGRFSAFGLRKANEIISALQAEHDAMSKLTPKGQRAKKKLKTPEDKADAYVQRYVNYTPKLRYKWKNPQTQDVELEPLSRALRRFIQEIRDPVVRHRVELFERMLDSLVKQYCPNRQPAKIIVECVRELEKDSEAAEAAYNRRKANREENQTAREALCDMGFEPNDKNIRKFRLLQECKWKCPYTLERFMQVEFDDLIIHRIVPPVGDPRRSSFLKAASVALQGTQVEHMVPQSDTICDEWFNVTVTRPSTNDAKRDRIPYDFVLRDADKNRRAQLLENAADCFGGKESLKFKIFSSDNARSLIEERDKLQRTAYIARCLRYVCLLKFGWLSKEDRDPGHEKANDASRHYLVTNGGITHRLREAWNLDELLRDIISDEQWKQMGEAEKERALSQGARIPSEEWKKLKQDDPEKYERVLHIRRTKNRQDVRHHALDAMIASCTLPWAANSTVWAGGWCNLDPEDGSVSSVHCPIFGENDYGRGIYDAAKEKLVELKAALPSATSNTIKHYRPHGRHKQVFESQLYGKRTTYDGKELKKPALIVAKKLSELTPASLDASKTGNVIFSTKIRQYITDSWKKYTSDVANWRKLLELEQEKLEAEKSEEISKKKPRPKTLEALGKRLGLVKHWLEEPKPSAELWKTLQEFLHQEKVRRVGNAEQRKDVFPDDFIATLRHWLYSTPIRSVQVIAQTKDEKSFVELRPGSKTFWKYKGRYQEVRVYELPPKTSKGKSKFICWRVRPFYPRKHKENGKLETWKEARSAAMPEACRGQKFIARFHNGQVVRFTRSFKNMDISHNWMICETNPGGVETNTQVVVMPAHLATIVTDPDNPRKRINLKDTENEKLGLNDFMWALGYGTEKKDELPHSPSTEPESSGAAEA